MEYFFGGIIGYLFGSFPAGFLLIKKNNKKNIFNEGSASSGATNAYRISGSKLIGFSVFIIDFFKGIAAILIIKYLFNYNFGLLAITSIFSVLGHCFSVWTKFKGGKGIATMLGILLIISPFVLIIWGIIWLAAFAYKRSFHLASIASSALTSVLCFSSSNILVKYSKPQPGSELLFSISLTIIFLIILTKHYETIIGYFGRNNKKN